MNKNAIQKYALWARKELIEQVKQRAYQYGIDESGFEDPDAIIVRGRVLSNDEKRQRKDFIRKINASGFEQAIEEVAYTWFNRFIALRFMEVNDYLPSHIRVFSDASGSFKPEILQDVLHLDLDGLDKAKVAQLLNANKTEELYRYLLLTQCNALNAALTEMFEQLGSYTEMLFPNNILRQESVLAHLVNDIDEDDWKDAVQIIGWMYQYYNTEPKQAVFDGLKKNVKISKENIPAATQLFTPDWIVRYMVENSLGRLWLESHPNATALKSNWKYYLDEAEQSPQVAEQLRLLRSQSAIKSPEDIKLIDPCMGSGHILVYAFDVLMQIYESEGYNPRDAAKLILEKNLYGLDIDRRAYQLAYFALMMKARQHNRRIFSEDLKPQLYYPAGFPDGEEYGSLVKVDQLPAKPERFLPDGMTYNPTYEIELNAWNFQRLLAQKYDVVVTNPPYMGGQGMNVELSDYVKEHYPDSKSDLFSCFIERGLEWIKPTGYNCMVTMQSWMFLSSFETMRKKLLSMRTITNLLHMENMVMGIAFGTAVANLYGQHISDYKGQYSYMTMKDIEDDKPIVFPTSHKRNCTASTDNFEKIPGNPVAYWVGETIRDLFHKNKKIDNVANPRQGLATGNNDHYLRFWSEVAFSDFAIECINLQHFFATGAKYVPYNKGGTFRKWYGNIENVIRFDKANYDTLQTVGNHLPSKEFYFKESITWSKVTSGGFSMRYVPKGSVFDVAGCSIFSDSELKYLLGLSNSVPMQYLMNVLSQTLNYEVGSVKSIPVIFDNIRIGIIEEIVNQSIFISRTDWDAFETSWDFKRHPLLNFGISLYSGLGDVINGEIIAKSDIEVEKTETSFKIIEKDTPKSYHLQSSYEMWQQFTEKQFAALKSNEEELNRIFIDIYGLQDELSPEVADKDVTVRRADLGREIRSLISYAVGCMFGRYSLDVEGLAYAGGDWDASKYRSFIPDKDNILPISDDEYFDDDILGRFVEFVSLVYGAETLEANLKFIANALGGKGAPREVIRNYFLNDFYKDHLKVYQKRPIYWLFDSGKKHGFKALVYMHRYSSDLLARLRTDYVHEQQERYRTQIAHIDTALDIATGAERAKLLKEQSKLDEQLKEIGLFEEKVHQLADQHIVIDLDDGVKKNYAIFADVLAKI